MDASILKPLKEMSLGILQMTLGVSIVVAFPVIYIIHKISSCFRSQEDDYVGTYGY